MYVPTRVRTRVLGGGELVVVLYNMHGIMIGLMCLMSGSHPTGSSYCNIIAASGLSGLVTYLLVPRPVNLSIQPVLIVALLLITSTGMILF